MHMLSMMSAGEGSKSKMRIFFLSLEAWLELTSTLYLLFHTWPRLMMHANLQSWMLAFFLGASFHVIGPLFFHLWICMKRIISPTKAYKGLACPMHNRLRDGPFHFPFYFPPMLSHKPQPTLGYPTPPLPSILIFPQKWEGNLVKKWAFFPSESATHTHIEKIKGSFSHQKNRELKASISLIFSITLHLFSLAKPY